MAVLSQTGEIAVPVRTTTGTRYMIPQGKLGPVAAFNNATPAPQPEPSQGFDPNLILLVALAAFVILVMVLQ